MNPSSFQNEITEKRCPCGHLVIAHGKQGCLAMVKTKPLTVVRDGVEQRTSYGPVGDKCPCTKPDTLTGW